MPPLGAYAVNRRMGYGCWRDARNNLERFFPVPWAILRKLCLCNRLRPPCPASPLWRRTGHDKFFHELALTG